MGIVLNGRAQAGFVGVWLAAAGVLGCASHTPQPLAEKITRAVYADDVAGVTSYLDTAAKRTVTREEVGALSDRMHALGDLKALTPRSSDPDRGRYEYDATFARGSMLVQLRLDPDGNIGAYRVVTGTGGAAGA